MHTNKNDGDTLNPDPQPHGHAGQRNDENPGYETTDVNVNGVAVFLAGLLGFVFIFFVVCFGLGKVINNALEKSDGPVTKWNQLSSFAGAATTGGRRQDLTSDPEIRQKALQEISKTFPAPRLDVDDGEQATADLHAREDLLLDHYSSSSDQPGKIRIPIDQAMQEIVKKGLPMAPSAPTTEQLAEDVKPEVQAPLTTGFARTGYELDVMESREQKMRYAKAEGAEHAATKTEK